MTTKYVVALLVSQACDPRPVVIKYLAWVENVNAAVGEA